MRDRLRMLSQCLPELPLEAIRRATERRGGGPPVAKTRALEICRRLHEIDVLVRDHSPLGDMEAIVAEYMMLESELFGLGPGSGD